MCMVLINHPPTPTTSEPIKPTPTITTTNDQTIEHAARMFMLSVPSVDVAAVDAAPTKINTANAGKATVQSS